MDALKDLRNQIDQIDNQIMDLLDKRFNITQQVGDYKKQHNIQVLDQNREKSISAKTSKYSHSPQIDNVYKAIMKESKSQQRK